MTGSLFLQLLNSATTILFNQAFDILPLKPIMVSTLGLLSIRLSFRVLLLPPKNSVVVYVIYKALYKIGDMVYLSTKNIRTIRPSKKLDHVRVGPFKISKKIGTHAYKLQLPSSMKIHPVFHVNLLSHIDQEEQPDIPGRITEPIPPVTIEGEQHFEAEQILDSSIRYNRLWYLVRYKDYPDPSEDTWEPPENLWNCPDLIRDFHNRYPDKPNPNSLPSSSRRLASRRTRS